MKKTQRLIVVVGEASERVREEIAGFKACTVVKDVTDDILKNVYHFNKNAVYFCKTYRWKEMSAYNPVVIRLSKGKTNVRLNTLSVHNIIEDFPIILESNGVDTGDHESEDSVGIDMSDTKKCLLCQIGNGEKKGEHIVFASEYFYVVPGKGAFFDGYLMVVPKRHVMSFAQLNDEESEEFYQILNDLRMILKEIYGKPVFAFECGSGEDGGGKHETSIVHAHFHLAPTEMPVLKSVRESGLNPALIEKEELRKYSHYPYIIYLDQEDNWYIVGSRDIYFPRQHPRQILAEYMGCYDIYNWRTHPFMERMDVIAEEFRQFCKEHFHLLPVWTRECLVFDD